MTIGSVLSQVGTSHHNMDRLTEYHHAPMQDHFSTYGYEDSTHGHVSKHTHGGGGHKRGAALSALTLLAFLFFLNILQQCLRDHMNSMNTPQFMIMTAGKEGEENPLQRAESKLDKTGVVKDARDSEKPKTERNVASATKVSNDKIDVKGAAVSVNEKPLMKIKTTDYTPIKRVRQNKPDFTSTIANRFVSAMDKNN